MLIVIPALTCVIFGSAYPLFFWTNYNKTVNRSFYRFNLGLATIIGSVGLFFMWFIDLSIQTKIGAGIWIALLMAVTAYFWSKASIKEWIVTIPSLLGGIVFFQILEQLVVLDWSMRIVSVLSGLIICNALFAMILGHWYLNVAQLPIIYLQRVTKVLLILLVLRLVWDLYAVIATEVTILGTIVPLFNFLHLIDGVFIYLAFFFGALFPLIITFMALKSVMMNATQSATGLLYIGVISVAMGDLIYKYYLLQYGLVL
jgi:hypothetical protein